MSGGNEELAAVSVILPAYNAARTLARALRSLTAQTFGNWEAIVVDDGSTDRTAAIARQAARRDDRVRLIRQRQTGPSAARNAGLAEARGDWIVFLDSDDTLPPGYLAAMIAAAAQVPSPALLHCGWRRVSDGKPWRGVHAAHRIDDAVLATAQSCPFAIHAAFTPRAAIAEVGGFDASLKISEDWDLWQRLARIGTAFVPVPDVTVEVNVATGSLSTDSERHLADGLMVLHRGHAADKRVPAGASGAPTAELPSAAWRFAAWVAAASLGRGADPVALLSRANLPAPGPVDPFVLASIIEDGLAIGAGPHAPLYAHWAAFEAGVRALCDHVAICARSPDLADQTLRALEDAVAEAVPPGRDARIGSVAVVAIDVADPLHDRPLPDVSRVRARLTLDGHPLADMGMQLSFGALSADRQLGWVRALPDTAELRRGLVRARVHRGPWALGLPPLVALKQYARLLLSWRKPYRHRHAALPHEDVRAFLIQAMPSGQLGLAADTRLREIVEEVRAQFAPQVSAVTEEAVPWVEPDYTREAYWEGLFAHVDPWGYRNDYEALKYEQTLDLIRGESIEAALEIACAEGEFTRRLAAHAGHVLATDIAPTAVARAAAACADLANCSFQRLDLLTEAPPARYDLIVASEVLYYLDPVAMRAFVAKVERHLKPGGIFLTAHANLLVDEPDRTGFGWPHHFGAKGIGEIVVEHGGLTLEIELWTPLYRILRFRKAAPQPAPAATRIIADAARNLPPRVAAQVKWRGGREAPVASLWHDFPILTYHRIAVDGPPALERWRTSPAAFDAQLRHLRDTGWHGVSLQRLRAALHWGEPLPERSVMLTFDDATRDFLDDAVPLLHRYGFPATLFVPTGHVAGVAAWDATHGDPAPLLNWDELRLLRHCDVAIGAHGVTHRPLTVLGPAELIGELAGSRFHIEQELGQPVTSIAYPYGAFDPVIRDAAGEVGYDFAFTCIDGRIADNADPLALFRREVFGNLDLADFEALIDGR